jgi:hypothetical protein
MVFKSSNKINISCSVEEIGYDLEYERRVSKENNVGIRNNKRHVTCNQIYLKKEYIPDLMILEEYATFSPSESVTSGCITLNNDIHLNFDDLKTAQFWFMIFTSTEFEGKTIEDIKKEYPEEFI